MYREKDMVGIAAEGSVFLPASHGQEEPHEAQGFDGTADSGNTGPYVTAYGPKAGMAASAVPGLKVQVESRHKDTAFHRCVKDAPGDQGKPFGDRKEALVDANGVDHASKPLIVAVGVDMGYVPGVRQFRDCFSGSRYGHSGEGGQRGQGLPAAAKGIPAAVQDGPQAAGAKAERSVQNKLIGELERSVRPTRL